VPAIPAASIAPCATGAATATTGQGCVAADSNHAAGADDARHAAHPLLDAASAVARQNIAGSGAPPPFHQARRRIQIYTSRSEREGGEQEQCSRPGRSCPVFAPNLLRAT
jgi:hypothetical protein